MRSSFDAAIEEIFERVPGYVDTAAVGLPTRAGAAALDRRHAEWREGRTQPVSFDPEVERSRQAYARIVGSASAEVAIVSQVSAVSGVVAASLDEGAVVLAAEEDFTSVLFPFMARPDLELRLVPLAGVLDEITPDVDLVAVSAVQSSSGIVTDLDRLSQASQESGVRTYVDLTQGAGWIDAGASRFDVTACHGYKWLCSPRGAGFMTVNQSGSEWVRPLTPGWYSGEKPWESIYGPPLRLAADARRFDLSPAWFSYSAAAPTLEALADLGTGQIRERSLGLANAFRESVGISASNSPIVSVSLPEGVDLAARGVAASSRAGRARLSWYVYNTEDDVERAAEAVRGD